MIELFDSKEFWQGFAIASLVVQFVGPFVLDAIEGWWHRET